MKFYQLYIFLLNLIILPAFILNSYSQSVILDNFQNDYRDTPSQNRLSAAYGYSKFGPENVQKRGGGWTIYRDEKGSKITAYNSNVINENNINNMIYNNVLHVNLMTSSSRQNYPLAGIRTYLLGNKDDYHDLSNLKEILIRCKGEGYIRLALQTEDIINADKTGFYGADITLQKEWKTYNITTDMLKPEPFSHAHMKKWTWDHGKHRVNCLDISAGYYLNAKIFIDEIAFNGMSHSDFGFEYHKPPYETFTLSVTSNVYSPVITTIGSGSYVSSSSVLLRAFSSEPFYKFKNWSLIKGIIDFCDSTKQESFISISQDVEMTAVFEYTGPEKGPYYITLTNSTVDEKTPGARIGNIAVYNRDKNKKHKLSVNDKRFIIQKNQLTLKKGVSLDYIQSPSVPIEITAVDNTKLSCTKKFTIQVKNKGALENIKYAGFRSSYFGVKPFPNEKEWGNAMNNISAHFPGSVPNGVWILGRLDSNNCRLEFASDGGHYDHIRFNTKEQGDKHEPYLTYFDTTGITVYLQVEPAFANIDTLIDLVLSRYSKHTCVIGFGIDVEWFQSAWGKTNKTIAPTDKQAKIWENKIKSYNPAYKLFLKHWLVSCMPPSYHGDIVFIDDSQGFMELEHMTVEFLGWANHFPNNIVMYQVGYSKDYHWWKQFENPTKHVGEYIAERILYANPKQEVGIIWVDYTLRKPEIEPLMK